MASITIALQQPYIKSENSDLEQAKIENEAIRKEVTRRKKSKEVLVPYLNKKETRIYLFLIQDRKHMVKIKTDFTIYPVNWDFTNQRAKKSMIGSLEFNERLDQLKEKTRQQYNRIILENPSIGFNELSDRLKDSLKKALPIPGKQETSFFKILDEFIKSKSATQASRTIQKYNSVKKSLEEFSKLKYKHGLKFEDINLRFLDSYLLYLRTQKPRGRQKTRPEGEELGLLNDTIEKYISTIKAFMEWSKKRNDHSIELDKDFRISRNKDVPIVTLSPDELKDLYNYDFSNIKHLDKVRDLFCFSAFTGQRWSDVDAFKKEDLKGDCWKFRSYKTKKEIELYLVGFAAPSLDILRKYNFELPKITLQKMNDYIKVAAEKAGINEHIRITKPLANREILFEGPKHDFLSSHSARRTCVSILLNYEFLPIQLVMQITGHTKLEVLQKYIFKDKNALRKALEKTNSYNK